MINAVIYDEDAANIILDLESEGWNRRVGIGGLESEGWNRRVGIGGLESEGMVVQRLREENRLDNPLRWTQ